ncbi:MAG: hypothetical protein R2761_14975 [Acidimicrobiales bacterium]
MATRGSDLVVQVHPLEDSYSAALREAVLAALGRADTPCYRLCQGERPPIGALREAGRIVLVYPTWSGGLPSHLLGWLHELFDGGVGPERATELVAVTTCGSSQFVNRVQGEWGRRYLRTELLGRCAPGARFRWLCLYKVDRRSRTEMASHLDRVAAALTPR